MSKTLLKLISVLMIFLVILIPVSAAKQLNLTYDLNGNLVTGDGKFRVYNDLNQLWKVYNGSGGAGQPLEVLTYHPAEERVLIKRVYYSNGSLKERTFYVTENFVQVKNISGTFNFTYVYHEGQLIAQKINGKKQFISTDLEGSSTVVTNSTGQQIENTSYTPYGEVITGGTASKLGYEGKEHDTIVGDTDFHFRKYNPSLGIFTQPDTLIQNVYDPQQLNRYMFERGNPYKYTDPTGHYWQLILAGGFMMYAQGDTAIMLVITVGYLDLWVRSNPEDKQYYFNKFMDSLFENVGGAFTNAAPKSWLSVGQEWTELKEEQEKFDEKKKKKEEQLVCNLESKTQQIDLNKELQPPPSSPGGNPKVESSKAIDSGSKGGHFTNVNDLYDYLASKGWKPGGKEWNQEKNNKDNENH